MKRMMRPVSYVLAAIYLRGLYFCRHRDTDFKRRNLATRTKPSPCAGHSQVRSCK
jgi:hypothetical protein